MKTLSDFIKDMMTVGTPACGVACGAAGVVLAALLLSIGLWNTLFVAALCLLGVFLGGVKDKHRFIKGLANKLFPSKE